MHFQNVKSNENALPACQDIDVVHNHVKAVC